MAAVLVRRGVHALVILIALSASAVAASPQAGATTFTYPQQFYWTAQQGTEVQCASSQIWMNKLHQTGYGTFFSVMGQTQAKRYAFCSAALNLPSQFVEADAVLQYWDNGHWNQYLQKQIDYNSNNGNVATASAGNFQQTYGFLPGDKVNGYTIHFVLAFGTWHNDIRATADFTV